MAHLGGMRCLLGQAMSVRPSVGLCTNEPLHNLALRELAKCGG
jgi:hypothetical protein